MGFKCNDSNHGNEYVAFSQPDFLAAIADMTNAITGGNVDDNIKLDF